MKNWMTLFCLLILLQSVGQEVNNELEFTVIKETLPQVLDANPISFVSYLKGGRVYESLLSTTSISPDSNQLRVELDLLADSIAEVLKNTKIIIQLSDTLFAYKYSPTYMHFNFGDGWVDTFDLRDSSTWSIKYEDLVEVFQTNHKYRGLSKPIDLEFIELIKTHINLISNDDIPIDINELSSSNYSFTTVLPLNHDSLWRQSMLLKGIRVFRPVFNSSEDRACYLFSYETRTDPWREFVFVEKKNGKWYFLESYGSKHVDKNETWFK